MFSANGLHIGYVRQAVDDIHVMAYDQAFGFLGSAKSVRGAKAIVVQHDYAASNRRRV